MRCRNCGIQIASGTLCEDCYNEFKRSRDSQKDTTILMKITRKFLPKYQLLLNFEWFLFAIVASAISITAKNPLVFVGCIIFVLIMLGISLFFNKRIALGTKCIFYETKVVYTFDFLFIHKKQIIKYSDIKDITYNQSSGFKKRLQKKFGLGNIAVINKNSKIIFDGFIINDVANIEEVFNKLTQLVGDKIF